MAGVIGLGYVVIEAKDLGAWKQFACDLLGFQASVETADRLKLRVDEKSYRLDIRRGNADSVAVLGWEVKGAEELEELRRSLEAHGFQVECAGTEQQRERGVSGLLQFRDPEGLAVELFYGLTNDPQPFISPKGVHFLTGSEGMGHAFQMVRDSEAYRRLYQEVLGFQLSDYIDFGPDIHATFVHANTRHHSFAWATIPNAPQGIGHLMFEVDDLDDVGRAWEKVEAGAAPVAATLGRHSNDEMLSFYARTPSGFQIEYGFGGKKIAPDWAPSRFTAASHWGHKRTDPNEPDV